MGRTPQQHRRHQSDVAVDAWFPRPVKRQDVVAVDTSAGLGADDVHSLLCHPLAREWRDKVGVVGRSDGSAKHTTRLLECHGWIAKMSLDDGLEDMEQQLARVKQMRDLGRGLGVWHPGKRWFLFEVNGRWHCLTLCPKLVTLRQLERLEERLAGWTEMLVLAVRVAKECGVGLDVNPSNFGYGPEGEGLCYVDDEFYPGLEPADVAAAIAARIPEEPGFEASVWRGWGQALRDGLSRQHAEPSWWEALVDGLRAYPLAASYEAARRVVGEAFSAEVGRLRRRSSTERHTRGLTLVFADVHANLPALDAVLDEAGRLGADEYLFLGDVVGYGPHPRECIARLAGLKSAALLKGNHDNAVATGELDVGMNQMAKVSAEWTIDLLSGAERRWLGALAAEVEEADWLAVHGAPRDPYRFFAYVYELTYEDNLRYMSQQSKHLCFVGHTHMQLAHTQGHAGMLKHRDVSTLKVDDYTESLVNPGSVGQPRDADTRAAFALWNRADNQVTFHRVAYDVERTCEDLREVGLPQQLCRRLRRAG